MLQTVCEILTKLIRKLRRYFPPGASPTLVFSHRIIDSDACFRHDRSRLLAQCALQDSAARGYRHHVLAAFICNWQACQVRGPSH